MFARHVRSLALLLALLLVACGLPTPPPPPTVSHVRPGGGSGVQAQHPLLYATAVPTPTWAAYPVGYPGPPTRTPTLNPTAEEATFSAELAATLNPPAQTPIPQGPLLRSRWPAPPADTAVHTLIVSLDNPAAFWQIDLRDLSQRRELYRLPSEPFNPDPVTGVLSPAGAWIAYLSKDGKGFSLRVVRSDGSDDREVERWVGHHVDWCSRVFAWSPDGHQLVFQDERPQPNGHYASELYRYTPASGDAPVFLARYFDAALLGWADDQHVLVAVVGKRVAPWHVESLNATTGQPAVLGVAPTTAGLSCAQLAPNRQAVLLRSAHRAYHIDLATRTWQEFDLGVGPIVWGPSSNELLKVPSRGDEPVLLFDLATPTTPLTLTLMPAYTEQSWFGLLGVSPDGQYLLLCESRESTLSTRTLLYAVARHQWEVLREDRQCLTVIGWRAGPIVNGGT